MAVSIRSDLTDARGDAHIGPLQTTVNPVLPDFLEAGLPAAVHALGACLKCEWAEVSVGDKRVRVLAVKWKRSKAWF